MQIKRKLISRALLATLATAAIGLSTPAAAAVSVVLNPTCSGNCFTGLDIVNLTSATGVTTGVGTVDGLTVNFTSTSDLLDLENGAATVSTNDGSGFGQLTFKLLGGFGFSQADFGILQATNNITFHFHLSDGTLQDIVIAAPTGNEPFGVQAAAGTFITQVDIDTADGTYKTFKQLKLGGFSPGAVPEPATWAMMLVGFAGIGMSMRRRKTASRLLQVA